MFVHLLENHEYSVQFKVALPVFFNCLLDEKSFLAFALERLLSKMLENIISFIATKCHFCANLPSWIRRSRFASRVHGPSMLIIGFGVPPDILSVVGDVF